VQALGVIILDTPHNLIEVLSSLYNLSLFSSKAGSSHVAGQDAVPERSSSESIGDLWPKISSAGNVDTRGSSVGAARSHLEASTSCHVSGAWRVSTER
jgi:hypothetical protein